MRVLVTGGGGFIGSYVCEALWERDIEPIVFDRRTGQHLWAQELGDVRDYTSVSEAVYHSDGVIHLAAILGTQETVADPRPAAETNILGSLNVDQACKVRGVPAVYIAVGNHWMNNPYSISKTAAERFALMFNAEHGTGIAVVRAMNAYGPRQKAAPVRKILPNFISRALQGEPIQVYGDGEQVMDMIYVADVAEILVRALLEDHGNFVTPFEAGTGRRTTVNDIARMVLEATGSASMLEHLPMRPGEVPGSVVLGDPETLRPLGMDPADLVPLEEGIRRTVAHFRGPA